MAASWTVGVLASMAGGRGGGGGRTVAVVPPFLRHGEEVKMTVGDFRNDCKIKVLFQIWQLLKTESD